MTVKELYERCKDEIEIERGDSEIVLCVNDNNDFYLLECGFSSPVYNKYSIYDFMEENNIEEDDVIVLG